MPSIRRGFAPGKRGDDAGAARAKGGSMVSRNGSANAMPAPCRKWRRESGRRVAIKGAAGGFGFIRERAGGGGSLRLEELALHDLVDERADAIAARGGALEDAIERRAVGESHRCAGRENDQLAGE